MTAKTYHDYIRTGEMTQQEAIKHQSVREASKAGMRATLDATVKQGLPAEVSAFGALDIIAVSLVKWYGPAAAGEVLRHYAEVCERQAQTSVAQ
ncbi:hypothetical protein LH464_04235 [Neorhizobium sp. T786]|uniref:hypothetical protein n=1 Tax=Pseudorhizobium xiangyangii TaxID=2883104 RepID=UPI001CFFF68F|nr:hypothetical protein [Neorhizobium xiangyangii]MCB5201686.1 hypothetical protein [Neorhizobium xiangyangii]